MGGLTAAASAVELQNNVLNTIIKDRSVVVATTWEPVRTQLGLTSNSERLLSEINAKTDLLNKQRSLIADQTIATAQAQAVGIVNTARSTGLYNTLTALNIRNATMRDEFVKLMSVLDNSGARILSGVGASTPIFSVG